jgi:hypothetical protein
MFMIMTIITVGRTKNVFSFVTYDRQLDARQLKVSYINQFLFV